MNVQAYIPNRTKFARLFYGLAIVFLLHRAWHHLLLSQLHAPVLTYTNTDLTYIFLKWSGISTFIIQHYAVALLFDVCLVGSAIIAFIFPRKAVPAVTFTILSGMYIVIGYSYLCFHKHNLTGLWWASFMFIAIRKETFTLLFELTRYYALFTYFSAGFWKFYRHVWNAKGHFAVILKADATPYMVEQPGTLKAQLITWLVLHPMLMDSMMLATCFIQISYIIGLFTKRLDWLFFTFAITFHIMSLVLLRAYFIEFSLILITLLPVKYLYHKNDV